VIERCLAIQKILEQVENEDLALTTTGMVSREAFVANDRPGNFYMLGSLGLLSSFGLGLALLRPERWVFVLEGDGSALMSMGTLALIPTEAPRNLVHIILQRGI
jgi:thiamine pyrophosphate-dependent acetolactate synthase large subunit-like protein